ncbi:MAG: WcaF family extracellular polysaccharide biosynthesis acetyltransferase [Cytophagaceae bacterium]|nr:WcaF family extracellular polysaccharide biosynthesis acetyltransferase [Cytophagaceae bacterium]
MLKTDLTTFNNQWYQPGPRWKIILWFLINPLTINSYLPIPAALKRGLLRLFGAKIGRGVLVKPHVNVKYPWFLEIGDFAWIGENVWIDNLAPVRIGRNACLSQGALLLTGNHDYTRASFDLEIAPITLEDGAWAGAKTLIGPGVTLGSHAVLAAGSVATRSLEPYGIYQGNPAQLVRKRSITA